MIRETIREMKKVAIGRVVLTNREHIIGLEPMDKGLVGALCFAANARPGRCRSKLGSQYSDPV